MSARLRVKVWPVGAQPEAVGTVEVGDDGTLTPHLEGDSPHADRLRAVIGDLAGASSLPLRVEGLVEVNGVPARVLREEQVPRGAPRFPFAVADVLGARYGFRSEVIRGVDEGRGG